MDITMKRSIQIGKALERIVNAMNVISEEELVEYIAIGERKHTIDPFLDPTRYRLEGDSITQGQKVLRALLEFKRGVKGIGNFR